MKKKLLVLGMTICMLVMTACGQGKGSEGFMTAESATQYATDNIVAMNQVVAQNAQDQVTDEIWSKALESWVSASEDMGSYEDVISVTSTLNEKEGTIDALVKGSKRNAIVQFVFKRQALTGVAVNVEYTFGEKMEKAGLNTLLGMGTVFVMLILISLIISLFAYIPKIQAAFAKKPAASEVKEAAVDNTIAQIIEKEELSDDLELVAVISAAIAASEGAASTDGFVVRSIRRSSKRW